jgi:hypothetical protein
MQKTKMFQYLTTLLLLLSIFSFATMTLTQEGSELPYETLLDDTHEHDDKEEEESEKKLFILPQLIALKLSTQRQTTTLFKQSVRNFKKLTAPFRPPIFS